MHSRFAFEKQINLLLEGLVVTWLCSVGGIEHQVRRVHRESRDQQQRRTTDKLKRAYVARFTRVVTKMLPEAVAKAGDKFLEHNVEFPPRSPHSRMREQVRDWERGTHMAL